jgi:Tol biopolymer transport system component
MPIARLAGVAALLLTCTPALAHHKQTPPVLRFTVTGDNLLPRVPAFGAVLGLLVPDGSGRKIIRYDVGTKDIAEVTEPGQHRNPALSRNGQAIAWDSDADLLGTGDPGSQVYLLRRNVLTQVTSDPTGTSVNPAVSSSGTRVAWESTGDLAGTGNDGARQVFFRTLSGPILQASRGEGQSGNPALGHGGRTVVFDSTSDPDTGADTGVSQLWFARPDVGFALAITAGEGPSRRPAISLEGRVVAVESTADLAGDGADTGVSQIYIYDAFTGSFARITNDPAGCDGASVRKYGRDWRIAFACAGTGYYYQLRIDKLYRVPIDEGHTAQVVAEVGNHFVMVSTTADLVLGGTTPGHQLYLINLFRRPPTVLPGNAVWFPFRGIPLLIH